MLSNLMFYGHKFNMNQAAGKMLNNLELTQMETVQDQHLDYFNLSNRLLIIIVENHIRMLNMALIH